MAESMKSSLPTNLQNSVDDKPSETGSGKKIAKPEDLVRIYDIILQVCNNFFFQGLKKPQMRALKAWLQTLNLSLLQSLLIIMAYYM